MQQAMIEALQRGDYAAAAEAARAQLQSEPDNADAHHLLGLALRGLGDADGATRNLDRAIALQPDNAVFHVSRANAAMRSYEIDVAKAALDEAIRLDPNQLAAYITRAHIALAQRDLDEAERQLKLVLRVDPDHPYALVVQGNVALARGQHDEAIARIAHAAQLAPEDAMVQSALGLAYLAKGHNAFAEQALRNALARQPDARRLRWALVETLRRQQRMAEALPELQALNDTDPADAMAAMLRGDLEMAAGRREDALQTWRRHLVEHAADPVAPLGRVLRSLVGAGLRDGAIELVEALLARQPLSDALWAARLGLAAGDRDAFKAQLDRWLAAMPDSLSAREHLAQYHEAVGEHAEAVAQADAVLAANPQRDVSQLVKLRAEVRDAPEAALDRTGMLLAAARSPAARRVALNWRGFALDRLGRHDEAAACWREMLAAPLDGALPLPAVTFETENTAQSRPDLAPPRLLWGVPGSTVERFAAALGANPDCTLLGDRFSLGTRLDGLWPPRPDRMMVDIAGWHGVLGDGGVDPARAIDWLPHWDARASAALPDALLLAVLRDPRDMLLNWWVFGSPQRFDLPDLALAASWLEHALRALAERLEAAPDKVVLLRGESADADPAAASAQLAAALGLPAVPEATEALVAAGTGLGGLSTAFPAGHWRHYAQALAEPFAALEAIAQRLGY